MSITSAKMDVKIRKTEDGSHTLFSIDYGDTYHSSFGALRESQYIFIDQGLNYLTGLDSLNILEIGFGTGLNALLSCTEAQSGKKIISYTAVEPQLISDSLVKKLNYPDIIPGENNKAIFHKIHSCETYKTLEIISGFSFTLINKRLQEVILQDEKYDLVYFDAFGPDAHPDLWREKIFTRLYKGMKDGGVLVTFSSRGYVKRNLRSAGFIVKRLEGPPGKRHMLRAIK